MINNIDYVLSKCISFSKLLYERMDSTVTYTVNRHISSTIIYYTLTPYILVSKETCEATVRAMSIIVRLSNALQIFISVVRTSSYNNTACTLE